MIEHNKNKGKLSTVGILWGSPTMKSTLNISNTIGFLAFVVF